MAYDTAVVGGGLSGMITALELATAGEMVVLYEAKPRLGGLANFQCEYGDVFYNLQHVVHHYLEKSWPTAPVNRTAFPAIPGQIPTVNDFMMLLRLLRNMATLDIQPFRSVSWNLSNNLWWRRILWPVDYQDIPLSSVTRYVEMIMEHGISISPLASTRLATFRVSPQATHEYLIEPLRQLLKDLGVNILTNTPALSLSPSVLNSKAVVSAIPPHCYTKLHDTTALYPFALRKMTKLAAETTRHVNISFQIEFKGYLKYPSRATLDLHKSAWGLVLTPIDQYRTEASSVWLGSCSYVCNRDRHGRSVAESSPSQFRESVIEQILECRELTEYFADVGIDIAKHLDSILDFHIDETWTASNDKLLKCSEMMTMHSHRESWSRPTAGSKIGSHVFLAGAHSGTGCALWSMESAVEAGKRTAIAVLQSKNKNSKASKVFLHSHDRHPIRFAMLVASTIVSILLMCYCVLMLRSS